MNPIVNASPETLAISAQWVFALFATLLGFMMWMNLKDIKDMLKKHDNDIRDLQIGKANNDEFDEVRQKNMDTVRELDHAVKSLDKTVGILAAKFGILNSDK